MAETNSATATMFDDENLKWLLWPAAGITLVYSLLASATWLSTGVVGGGAVWLSPMQALQALGAVVGGSRVDVWILQNTKATAVAAPGWFWMILLGVATMASVGGLTAWHGTKAARSGDPNSPERKKARDEKKETKTQRKAIADTIERKWPIPPPYDPATNGGPGVLLGTTGTITTKLSVAKYGTPVMVMGPTGSGKTRGVIGPNVANWPGPVVSTSVRLDDALLTLPHRLDRGAVTGFDPGGRLWDAMTTVGITPVVWDPVRLLQLSPDFEADALLLSTFLMSQTSARGSGPQDIWATLARQTMHRLLIIAVELGADLEELLGWVLSPKDQVVTPLKKIADTLPPLTQKHLGKMNQLVQRDGKIFDSIAVTMEEVSDSLDFTARNPDAPLVPMRITTDGGAGTLYLVADHLTQESHRPLFAACLRHLFHATETHTNNAQRLNMLMTAERNNAQALTDELNKMYDAQPGVGDQDDPLLQFRAEAKTIDGPAQPTRPLFALDELANLAPLPDFPGIVSTIRTRAQVITGIQEASQLETKWGRDGDALLANHPTRLQFGGSGDARSMAQAAQVTGLSEADAADMRMLKRGKVRVTTGSAITFDLDVVKTDKWIDPKRTPDLDEAVLAVIDEMVERAAAQRERLLAEREGRSTAAASRAPQDDSRHEPADDADTAADVVGRLTAAASKTNNHEQTRQAPTTGANVEGGVIERLAARRPAQRQGRSAEHGYAINAAAEASRPVVELFDPLAEHEAAPAHEAGAAARVRNAGRRMRRSGRAGPPAGEPKGPAARVAASSSRIREAHPGPGRSRPTRSPVIEAPAEPPPAAPQEDTDTAGDVDTAPGGSGTADVESDTEPEGSSGGETGVADIGYDLAGDPSAEELMRVAIHTLSELTMPGDEPDDRDVALVAEWAELAEDAVRDAWDARRVTDGRSLL